MCENINLKGATINLLIYIYISVNVLYPSVLLRLDWGAGGGGREEADGLQQSGTCFESPDTLLLLFVYFFCGTLY